MAKSRDPKVRVSSAYRGVKRVMRYPQHPFQLRTRPFQIQPFLIAPVLPGETLKNAMVQSRVVTDPIKHSLVGWWTEYFLFFVKHRDINYHLGSDFLEQMMLNPGFDPTAYDDDTDQAKYYHAAGGINYTRLCLETCVEWYFRDQGEDFDVAVLDGLPLAQITGRSWQDSLTIEPDYRTDRDVSLDMNDDGDITVQEMRDAEAHWEALRSAGLENMDYEDFLRTYGVQIREPDASPTLYRPELIRYKREWTYPTNTVSADTENLGSVASAASWAVAFRADKDRFFKEPGFIFGVTVARPKTYGAQQKGTLVHEMKSALSWLPAIIHKDYEKSFVEFSGTEGPLPSIFEDAPAVEEPPTPATYFDYKLDMRDLLVYGDQFVNFAADTAGSFMSQVLKDGTRRYPDATSIDNLFAGTNKQIRQDGIVNLAIAGRQRDRTPTGLPL